MAKKLGNIIRIVSLLSVLAAAASKLAPLLKHADPKLRKKFGVVLKHLRELKDDVMELGVLAVKEAKKAKR